MQSVLWRLHRSTNTEFIICIYLLPTVLHDMHLTSTLAGEITNEHFSNALNVILSLNFFLSRWSSFSSISFDVLFRILLFLSLSQCSIITLRSPVLDRVIQFEPMHAFTRALTLTCVNWPIHKWILSIHMDEYGMTIIRSPEEAIRNMGLNGKNMNFDIELKNKRNFISFFGWSWASWPKFYAINKYLMWTMRLKTIVYSF